MDSVIALIRYSSLFCHLGSICKAETLPFKHKYAYLFLYITHKKFYKRNSKIFIYKTILLFMFSFALFLWEKVSGYNALGSTERCGMFKLVKTVTQENKKWMVIFSLSTAKLGIKTLTPHSKKKKVNLQSEIIQWIILIGN